MLEGPSLTFSDRVPILDILSHCYVFPLAMISGEGYLTEQPPPISLNPQAPQNKTLQTPKPFSRIPNWSGPRRGLDKGFLGGLGFRV